MTKEFTYFVVLFLLVLRIYLYFQNLPEYPNGTRVRITTRVTSEPVIYTDRQYLRPLGFKVYLPLYPRVYYGDRIVVEGTVEGDKLKNADLISVKEKSFFLYDFRGKMISFFERSLPKNHSALVSGMVIGSKSGIGEELWEQLVKSGTAHVVVASGMNVSMIGGFLLGILLFVIPRKKAVYLVVLAIWIYSLISGFESPIVRACVMSSVALLAVATGRMYALIRTLFIAALVMLFVKPLWVTDLGFWLSFLATLSISVFNPKLSKILKNVPKIIREDLSTTLSAQIGVVPLLYYFFGQFNILSPLINVTVLWTVVPITIIGLLGGIAGTIEGNIGRLILYLSYPLTSWFLFVIRIFVKGT